jgi:hypothetical protein
MITLESRSLVTVNTMSRSIIVARSDRTITVFALDGDSPTRRKDVVMGVSIDGLEGKTAKNRRDGQVVPIGQMHNGRCHVRVVLVRGEQMVCTRSGLMLLTNEHRTALTRVGNGR